MKKLGTIFGCILALLALAPQESARGAATLLPPGENCFQVLSPTSGGPSNTGTGFVGLLGTITGGSGGTAGTYGGVALTGGSGSGATANITVSGGAVTAVTILNPGSQYVVGDTLSAVSANIGNVTGFSVPVSSVAINSSLAGGTVTMYVPGTSTFKQTWFNSDQAATHQNTNPVNLDSNGCAIIYGTGSYRQVLKDSLGNTIWDQVTTDTSANNNTFWAGLAGGTPNTITVTDAGFNGTDGSIIGFTALSTNTSSATLNPSGFGAIGIKKDTSTGSVALSGGEIVQGNPVLVVFRASDNAFHILNLPNSSAVQTAQTLCGAIGLKITNDATIPTTKLVVSADQVTMLAPSNQIVSRTSVSLSLNFSANGASGLDTGSFTASTWYNVYLIDTGTATAALGSLSATAPTMPSGYSYLCRLGAVRADGSANLFRTLQLGSRTQYQITAGSSNTTVYPAITSGTNTGALVSVAAFVPPTATQIQMQLAGNTGSGGQINAGPSNSNTSANEFIFDATNAGSLNLVIPFSMVLESSSVFYFSTTASGFLNATGWIDKVNAN